MSRADEKKTGGREEGGRTRRRRAGAAPKGLARRRQGKLAGVAQDLRALLRRSGRGLPAALYAIGQKLVGGRLMVPHGDRVDAAQSGAVEDQHGSIAALFIPTLGPTFGPTFAAALLSAFAGQDDVVRVLVLDHDIDDDPRRLLRKAPRNHVAQRAQPFDLFRQRGVSAQRGPIQVSLGLYFVGHSLLSLPPSPSFSLQGVQRRRHVSRSHTIRSRPAWEAGRRSCRSPSFRSARALRPADPRA